jgi:hypothetical protein
LSKRRKEEVAHFTSWVLQPGFYITKGNGELFTRTFTTKTQGTVEAPIRFRTINSAKDGLSLAGEDCAILCVTVENFGWGE